jgi:hypothetical protein
VRLGPKPMYVQLGIYCMVVSVTNRAQA